MTTSSSINKFLDEQNNLPLGSPVRLFKAWEKLTGINMTVTPGDENNKKTELCSRGQK